MCFHRWRFPVMVRARTPSEMVNTTYKISPVIAFVHSDVLFRGREREKEGGRVSAFFVLEIAFRFTASNVAVLIIYYNIICIPGICIRM